MKNVTWMEVAIAMPMVLTLSSVGGKLIVIGTAVIMTLAMGLIKWGKKLLVEKRHHVQPALVKVRAGK